MKALWILAAWTVAALALAGEARQEPSSITKMNSAARQFSLVPIGRIERSEGRTYIRLETRYQDGLSGLEQWSHLWVCYWFDRNDTPERRAVLRVHPRGNPNSPLTGVFATRSPMRPNLIAMSLCRVVAIQGTDIEIEGIDAFDQTPVLDLKPYIKGLDTPQGSLRAPGWIEQPER